MALIMIFQQDKKPLRIPELSELMASALGVPCFAYERGKKLSAAELGEASMDEGQVWVELPDLQPDEGEPIVSYEVVDRDERDDALQELIEEIVDQEPELKKLLLTNRVDVLLTFDHTLAGIEAGNAFAYVLAASIDSGLLVPGLEEDEETLWFDTAEDFADATFGDEDEDLEGEEWEDNEEKGTP